MLVSFFRKKLKTIKEVYTNMSLIYKFTIVSLSVLLIPAIGIGTYNHFQSRSLIHAEMIKSSSRTLEQAINNINFKIIVTEGIGEGIAYNQRIIQFLEDDFVFDPENIRTYNYNVELLKDQAYSFRESDIRNVGIYTNNETITENWTAFYSEKRLRDKEWFPGFISGKEYATWLPLHTGVLYMVAGNDKEHEYFTFVRKIYTNNLKRYLGIVALDIVGSTMFSSIDSAGGEFFVLGGNHKVLYKSESLDASDSDELLNISFTGSSGNKIQGSYLYIYDTLEALGIKVIHRVSTEGLIKTYQKTETNMILAIFTGIIFLEILTYFIFKAMFSRLKKIIDTMKTVSVGNFNVRIPITSRDELGVLAQDFNILIEKINDLIKDVLKKEVAHKNAQIMALQYQINPHFIYNTIDAFRMKLELMELHDTADALAKFGKILRYNIDNKRRYTTILEEVRQVKNYIILQKFRYGDRISFDAEVPEEMRELEIIKFILQPVVENCIKHAFTREKEQLNIDISFRQENQDIYICITDNGKGIPYERLEILNRQLETSDYTGNMSGEDGSIGLANINDRIKLFYGTGYHLKVESISDEYTRVMIRVALINTLEDMYV